MITNDFLENIMFTLDEMANTNTAESECDIDIVEPTIETDDEDVILDNHIMDQLTSEDGGEIIQYIYDVLDE